MLINNKTYTAQVDGFTSEGLGVCHVEGCAVFVPNAVAGEEYLLRITKAGSHSAFGKIESILVRSSHRISRRCPYAKLCGGCAFWHMDYPAELELKRRRVADALERIGGVCVPALAITGAERPEGYRNKAQFPVGQADGKPVSGFYQARSHTIVPVERCLIQPPEADLARAAVMEYVEKFHVSCYDEKTHQGLLRHIYVRRGAVTGQVLVCLVVNGQKLPKERELVRLLQQRVPGLRSVVLSVNTRRGNTVLGEQIIPLLGDGYVEDVLCGLRFRLSARSFYQVNHDQAERLYALALEMAALKKTETALDLYCGTGTITLCMARAAGTVIGVEVVDAAIADARENARRNGIENARFFCADAGEAAARLAAEGTHPDVIVVDPPRKGVSPAVIDAMVQMAPERIVYVSCDPATLARDVHLLSQRGYGLVRAQAVDMFPRCAHVETVVLMTKTDAGKG